MHRARERDRRRADPEKARAQQRKSWNANPERSAASNKRHREKRMQDPEKATKERTRLKLLATTRRDKTSGVRLTPEYWTAVVAAFDGLCCYCDRPGEMSVEHLTPICRGGTNEYGNLAPAHLLCNQKKLKKTVEEYAPDRAAEIRRKASLVCEALAT